MSKDTLIFLHGGTPSIKSRLSKLFSITFLVAGLFISALPISRPRFYPEGQKSGPAYSDIRQASRLFDSFAPVLEFGHDFGAIYGVVDPGVSLRNSSPVIYYWVTGQMVVRRSELGILSDQLGSPQSVFRPGHDFGVIYGGIDPGGRSQSSSQLLARSGKR